MKRKKKHEKTKNSNYDDNLLPDDISDNEEEHDIASKNVDENRI